MLFNSFQFLFFFIVVWLLFLVTRGTTRKIILLVASYYFYMCWSTRYIFVIWGITLIDYVAGLQIEKAELPARRRLVPGREPLLQHRAVGPFQILQLSDRLLSQRVAISSVCAMTRLCWRSFCPSAFPSTPSRP